jgi:hypothetical protein
MFLEVIMIQIVQVLKNILDCMLKGNRCYKNIHFPHKIQNTN